MKVIRINESAYSVVDWSGEELSTHATKEEADQFCQFVKQAKIKEYVAATSSQYFRQGDKRKFSQSIFSKEIEAAMHYGVVCAMQRLANSRVDTPEELVGEAQIILKDSYMAYKRVLGARMPSMRVEDLLK